MTKLETGLSADNLATRKDFIGGSDANIIMNGTPTQVYDLWLEKCGDKSPDDLSWILPVQMGVQSEPLNVKWFQHSTGLKVSIEDHPRMDQDHSFRRATLDGWIASESAVLECKHVNQFSKIAEVTEKYQPQLHHNMSVCGCTKAYLSVFIGTMTHEVVEVDFDPFYADTLLAREKAFWACVKERRAPVDVAPAVAPVDPSDWIEVDMSGNNAWTSLAHDYLETQHQAKIFKATEKSLKELMEPNYGLAFGAGLQIKRAKNGSLRIGLEK